VEIFPIKANQNITSLWYSNTCAVRSDVRLNAVFHSDPKRSSSLWNVSSYFYSSSVCLWATHFQQRPKNCPVFYCIHRKTHRTGADSGLTN